MTFFDGKRITIRYTKFPQLAQGLGSNSCEDSGTEQSSTVGGWCHGRLPVFVLGSDRSFWVRTQRLTRILLFIWKRVTLGIRISYFGPRGVRNRTPIHQTLILTGTPASVFDLSFFGPRSPTPRLGRINLDGFRPEPDLQNLSRSNSTQDNDRFSRPITSIVSL